MNLQISRTADGLKQYPMHKHRHYEVMIYLEGKGVLRSERGGIPFEAGTVVIVPPDVEHGSSSEHGFRNISLGGDFEQFFYFDGIIALSDNEQGEGRTLATLIWENRFGDEGYLNALCTAYLHFLLQQLRIDDRLHNCVKRLIREISKNALDSQIDLVGILCSSGYSEDYIRNRFKEITGKTPVEFLTEVRIRHACFLLNVYKDAMSVSEVAEACGFLDDAYFSRRFKAIVGVSPRAYRRQ